MNVQSGLTSKVNQIPNETLGYVFQWIEEKKGRRNQVAMRLICKKFKSTIDDIVAPNWSIRLYWVFFSCCNKKYIPSWFGSIKSIDICFPLVLIPKVISILRHTFELTSMTLGGDSTIQGGKENSIVRGIANLLKKGRFNKLTHLCLYSVWGEAEALLTLPFPNLTSLALLELRTPDFFDHDDDENENCIRAITNCSHFTNLKTLVINCVNVNDVKELVSSCHLQNLHTLVLRNCSSFHMNGFKVLSESMYLTNLTSLDLSGVDRNSQKFLELSVFASSTTFTNLMELNLGNNKFSPGGIKAFVASPYFLNLTGLWLEDLRFGLDEMQALAFSSQFFKLLRLNLSGCQLGRNDGIKVFAESCRFTSLTYLDLSYNGLDNDAISAFAQARHFTNLTKLYAVESDEDESDADESDADESVDEGVIRERFDKKGMAAIFASSPYFTKLSSRQIYF